MSVVVPQTSRRLSVFQNNVLMRIFGS